MLKLKLLFSGQRTVAGAVSVAGIDVVPRQLVGVGCRHSVDGRCVRVTSRVDRQLAVTKSRWQVENCT